MSTDNAASTVLLGMGKGSGIDIRKLAQDLTDVEKAPRESRLNADIEASEAKISGLAVLKYNVQLLVDQFTLLNDASELATPKATSADTTKVSITSTDGSALSGISDIGITSLAAAQRNKSNQYSSTTQSLNSGSAFTLTLTPGTGNATNVSIQAGSDTPKGIVNAINAANAGVNATLLAEDSSGSN